MTQDISSRLAENEPCMWDRATLVMLVSRTCITVTSMTENVIAHLRAAPMGGSLTVSAEHPPRLRPEPVTPAPGARCTKATTTSVRRSSG